MSEEQMIYKVLDTEIKEVGDRILEFVGSTEKQDRDGEVIKVDGWDLKNYKKNPVFMWAHDYRSPPIGKTNRVWVEDGSLKFKVEFAPPETYAFADTIYKLYKGGFLRATSVGFMPKEWSDGDGEKAPKRTFKKQELLELSGAPVPSNPDALMHARDQGLITVKEFEGLKAINISIDASINEENIAKALEDGLQKGGFITKPEETDDWIRIPVAECDVTATIDISKKEGIKALYCGKEKKVKTYMFDKRPPYNWTMARAKKWVEEHKSWEEEVGGDFDGTGELLNAGIKIGEPLPLSREKEFPQKREYSQAEIIDELDYLIRLLDTEGMNEAAKEDAWDLVREVMRLTGGDIPDDILEKVGAVLNQKNRDRLNQIKSLAQSVLDSAENQESTEEIEVVKPQIGREAIKQLVKDEISRLQGKVS